MGSRRWNRIVRWVLFLLPPTAFYIFLFRSLSSIPFYDDYDSVLAFLLRWQHEHGWQHVVEIVHWQHNEYRLMLESAVFGTQYALLGHTNIKALCFLGDLVVIPLCIVLFWIWRDRERGAAEMSALAFLPVPYLLFQLQYASSLNNAMAGLQNLPILLFALLSLYLASKKGRAWFAASLACLVLTIASSGNGMFLVAVGALMLAQRREFMRLAVWFMTGGAMCVIYFTGGYNSHLSGRNASILSCFGHLSAGFSAAFLGSICTGANPIPAIVLGIFLAGVFVVATWEKLYLRHPSLYYSMLFLFVTAVAVSGLRSDYGSGLRTALGSRYRINSVIIVILVYFYLADRYRSIAGGKTVRTLTPWILGVLLAGFVVGSDWAGQKQLLIRRQRLQDALLRWERHEPPAPVEAVESGDYTAANAEKGFFNPVEPTLSQAVAAGIYRLPKLPEQRTGASE
jgi:hypothetical protein